MPACVFWMKGQAYPKSCCSAWYEPFSGWGYAQRLRPGAGHLHGDRGQALHGSLELHTRYQGRNIIGLQAAARLPVAAVQSAPGAPWALRPR